MLSNNPVLSNAYLEDPEDMELSTLLYHRQLSLNLNNSSGNSFISDEIHFDQHKISIDEHVTFPFSSSHDTSFPSICNQRDNENIDLDMHFDFLNDNYVDLFQQDDHHDLSIEEKEVINEILPEDVQARYRSFFKPKNDNEPVL